MRDSILQTYTGVRFKSKEICIIVRVKFHFTTVDFRKINNKK